MIHELKCWPEYYQEVIKKRKSFELRKNDRPFACGDILRLREWCPCSKEYQGPEGFFTIEYILRSTEDFPIPGLELGYCIMSIRPARRREVSKARNGDKNK
ncbi:MAG: DUF3850 domain-containing protein [Patescibacteria group bacterium]|nr:DUF3850 domain-containing protein [Patescibacteria group bacterium]